MTPEQIRAALHEALDSAFAAALDAHLAGHGRLPSLPDRCQTPHAAAMTAAGPWPTGWRQYGAAVVTPGQTMLVLVRDDRDFGVRGAEFAFDVVRVGSAIKGVDAGAPSMLVDAGAHPLRAAIWALLGEWGTDEDGVSRSALL